MRTFLPVTALVLWFIALLLARPIWAGSSMGAWLLFNLTLALIPVGAALVFRELSAARAGPLITASAFAGWMLFLPNAPYVVTDLFFVGRRPGSPLWYDTLTLAVLAGVGVTLGYVSLAIVHDEVSRRWGPLRGWACALGALVLACVGIYIGRFQRWHSWHALTRPLELLRDLVGHFADLRVAGEAAAMVLVYSITFALGYVLLRVAAPAFTLVSGDPFGRVPEGASELRMNEQRRPEQRVPEPRVAEVRGRRGVAH